MEQEPSARMVRRKPEPPVEVEQPLEWWDKRGLRHPMNDAEFVNAFCEYVLVTTDDHSLVSVRNRAFRFIRNIMSPDLEKALTAYRAVYP